MDLKHAARARLSRRQAVQWLLSGAGLAILSACSPPSPAPAPTSAPARPAEASKPADAAPAATTAPAVAAKPAEAAKPADAAKPAAGTPKPGGTLRVGQVGDIATLDATFTPGSADIIWSIHDRLTAYDEKFVPQPMLAESWDLSSDGKSIKFNLRKGVQYHSGRELTSADVEYNIKRVQGGKSFNGQIEKQSKWWTSIETPDKNTIILKSDAPRPTLFDFFEYLNIQDKDTLEGPDAKSKGVGTGPYMLKEWVQGDHISLVKNKNYWQTGKPYLDGIEIKILADTQSMVAQMEAGALDFIITPPLVDLNRLKGDSKYQPLLNNDSGAVTVVGVSVPKPPFDKKEVRQALNYALDRKRYAESILLGTGSPTVLPWTSTSPGYDASKNNAAYGFDLEKSKALLAQAGVSGLEFDALVQANNAEVLAFSQVYQSDLSKLGIKLNIQKLEQAAWLDSVNKVTYRGIWIGGIAFAQLEPATTFQNSRGLDPTANSSGFVQDRYTQLVTQANAEPDKAKRKAIYDQLNDLFIDESFLMVLSTTPARALATAKVKNVKNQAHGGFMFTETWME